MAFSPEQQQQLDLQIAIIKEQTDAQMAIQTKQTKLEAVRLAKEVLIENSRNKPVDSRDITSQDIIDFAEGLITYVNN